MTDESKHAELRSQFEEISRMLSGLINGLEIEKHKHSAPMPSQKRYAYVVDIGRNCIVDGHIELGPQKSWG